MKSTTLFLVLIAAICFSCEQTSEKTTAAKTTKDNTQNISQKNNPQDEALIRTTIGNYFEGWMTGDTSKIGSAMHATCQLKNIKEDKVIIFDRATYLGFFSPRPRRENSGGKIIAIDITGTIASAKCEIDTPKRLFTDYFNMMKLGDRWYIVDKIATNVAKE